MKKLINHPRNIVREALEGVADITPGVMLLETENVIVRQFEGKPDDRPVAVISGGGSGHEPAHAGYVGAGMLAAAVAGDVFTSPGVDAILSGIRASAGPNGAVLIVKNYTGDRLNFGLAAELASAEGIPTEVVVVADDVALSGRVDRERRRGIAGTVFVHKIAGAAAARGLPLAEVAAAARKAAEAVGTMGVGLGPCIVPSVGKPGFELGENEIELGLGIHGEPGVGRGGIEPADALVEKMLNAILEDAGLPQGQRIALLVNGLGATPPIELSIVARHALAFARSKGLVVERLYSGLFLTALDMPGCSLSVLAVDDEMLAALDAPTTASAWTADGKLPAERKILRVPPVEISFAGTTAGPQAGLVRAASHAAAAALIEAEAELADLDGRAGDGDLGASMVRGAEAILALPEAAFATPALALRASADAVRKAIGGSSGPFYAAGLARAGTALEGVEAPNADAWHAAFTAAVAAVEELGGAKIGDRTMVDALRPASEEWKSALASGASPVDAFETAVAAARDGAEATRSMMPRLGRASYVGERALGLPDGGAVAVSIWLAAIARELGERAAP